MPYKDPEVRLAAKREEGRRYRERYPEKVAAKYKRWASLNKERISSLARLRYIEKREEISESCKSHRDNLADGYVAAILKLSVKVAPSWLLDLKRLQLRALRRLKELGVKIPR